MNKSIPGWVIALILIAFVSTIVIGVYKSMQSHERTDQRVKCEMDAGERGQPVDLVCP